MCCIGMHELILGIDLDAISMYKNIVPQTLSLKGFKVQVLRLKVQGLGFNLWV